MARKGRTRKEAGLTPEQLTIVQRAMERIKKATEQGYEKVNKAYQDEYRTFIIWVLRNNLRPYPELLPCRFITRATVDKYYAEEVPKRQVTEINSLHRIRWALEKVWKSGESVKLNDETEAPLAPGESEHFVIESDAVTTGEEEQQRNMRMYAPIKFRATDPFKGLMADLLTNKEKRRIMEHIMKERGDWRSCGASFNLGCNAGVRGETTRTLVLPDLYVSLGFAPGQLRNLSLVLRRGGGKGHFATDRLVGTLRHRDYLLCAGFTTAMNVVWHLRDLGDKLHFLCPDPEEPAEWWQTEFVKFKTLKDESNSFEKIYEATGIKSCKVTHHRTHCVMHASTEGLQQYQVSTLTKHVNDKLTKSYWSEMERKTMCVMAGFELNEPYYVPRTKIGLPTHDIETCIEYVIGPHYKRWKEQQQSPTGDKSECAEKFFSRLIPFLVEILVQDGIYLINEFPEHPMSSHLLRVIPQYDVWAARKRAEVARLEAEFEPDQMKVVTEATQGLLRTLSARTTTLEEAVRDLSLKNSALDGNWIDCVA